MGGETENTILAALKFAEFAHRKDSPFTGTVLFEISDNEGVNIVKTVSVQGADVQTFDGRPPADIPVNCTVKADKTILLAILTGALDASTAFLWGQLLVDDITLMTEFTKAFDFSHQKFLEFQQSLAEDTQDDSASPSPSPEQSLSLATTTAHVPHSEGETESALILQPQYAGPVVASLTKKPLKQALAIKSLDLLQALRGVGKEIDALMVRVKEKDSVKKAFEELDEKTQEFQTTNMYKQIQSNAVYVTLKTELERGASVVGQTAKGIGMDVVVKLVTIAYPQNNEKNESYNKENSNNNSSGNETNLAVSDGSVSISSVDISIATAPLNKEEIAAAKKELKRQQLQEKLEKLQVYNKELGEQRKQRLATAEVKAIASK